MNNFHSRNCKYLLIIAIILIYNKKKIDDEHKYNDIEY